MDVLLRGTTVPNHLFHKDVTHFNPTPADISQKHPDKRSVNSNCAVLLLLFVANCPGARGSLFFEHLDRLWRDRWLVGGLSRQSSPGGGEYGPLHLSLRGPLYAGLKGREGDDEGESNQLVISLSICVSLDDQDDSTNQASVLTIISMEDFGISFVCLLLLYLPDYFGDMTP